MTRFRLPNQKDDELFPSTTVPPLQAVVIGDHLPADSIQEILTRHDGRINQFLDTNRQGFSLSPINIWKKTITHPELDITYENKFGYEKLILRPYPFGKQSFSAVDIMLDGYIGVLCFIGSSGSGPDGPYDIVLNGQVVYTIPESTGTTGHDYPVISTIILRYGAAAGRVHSYRDKINPNKLMMSVEPPLHGKGSPFSVDLPAYIAYETDLRNLWGVYFDPAAPSMINIIDAGDDVLKGILNPSGMNILHIVPKGFSEVSFTVPYAEFFNRGKFRLVSQSWTHTDLTGDPSILVNDKPEYFFPMAFKDNTGTYNFFAQMDIIGAHYIDTEPTPEYAALLLQEADPSFPGFNFYEIHPDNTNILTYVIRGHLDAHTIALFTFSEKVRTSPTVPPFIFDLSPKAPLTYTETGYDNPIFPNQIFENGVADWLTFVRDLNGQSIAEEGFLKK
jgi:hypothetical protein